MFKRTISVLVTIASVAAFMIVAAPAQAASVEPVIVDGNPTCADLGYDYGIRFDPPNSGTKSLGGMVITFTKSADNKYATWSSNLGVDAVTVKGGDAANVYYYDPEATGDTGLVSPLNKGGQVPDISHIDFCFDFEVSVTKTADPYFTRTYRWTIDKSADQSDLTLSVGQTFSVNYSVKVDATYVDSDFGVSGQITIYNPAPDPATVTGVSDLVDGIAANVVCPQEPPFSVPAGGSVTCSYSAALPDKSTRTNTATVTTSGKVGGGSGTAQVVFGSTPTTEVDKCIDITDSLKGSLGTVCYGEKPLPYTFNYTYNIGPYEACGDFTVENTASFVAEDTGAQSSDTWLVDVNVPCLTGCTLTQGYWKTHSAAGPAPYDPAWKNLGPDEHKTIFFLSGQTWHQVFWTPPAGNPYYNLAHQYMAAKLNLLNGAASTPAVDAAIQQAEVLFGQYTPSQTAGLKGQAKNTWTSLAGTLDRYNNGLIGPCHCDE